MTRAQTRIRIKDVFRDPATRLALGRKFRCRFSFRAKNKLFGNDGSSYCIERLGRENFYQVSDPVQITLFKRTLAVTHSPAGGRRARAERPIRTPWLDSRPAGTGRQELPELLSATAITISGSE